MILNDRGSPSNITQLAKKADIEQELGTDVFGLTKALKAHGIDGAHASLYATMDDLAVATSRGHAAIAQISTPKGAHFVVVDGVTKRQGQAVVAIRDPGNGKQYFLPKVEFESKFTGQVVFTEKLKRKKG